VIFSGATRAPFFHREKGVAAGANNASTLQSAAMCAGVIEELTPG
jgi:hypothetical protein